ncbi:hypothetical protein QNH28_03100 [Paenibacillus sp. G2S3]|uniref:hypothetical protein n=1 Tax=Paenibacillus sp. G2S3 TaxID=3047872 RepID=UPI0024C1E059|nr:hypothetical protein [Paenibacillus sp. G2S3]WHY20029.1 hypothetical protein QNH28_03100 [Paenibacillus sp. G2S3]
MSAGEAGAAEIAGIADMVDIAAISFAGLAATKSEVAGAYASVSHWRTNCRTASLSPAS